MYKTQRLIIREFEPDDIDPLIDLFSSSKVMRFIGPRRTMAQGEAGKWLEAQLIRQQSEVTRCAVSLLETGELIGVCGFQKIDGEWDFGYYLRESYWGHGYATEACGCLLSHARKMINGEDFQIFIADGNTNSRKVIERCDCIPATKGIKDNETGWYYITAQHLGET
jgi:RimJ/RimL family protein N-acetyltransferase